MGGQRCIPQNDQHVTGIIATPMCNPRPKFSGGRPGWWLGDVGHGSPVAGEGALESGLVQPLSPAIEFPSPSPAVLLGSSWALLEPTSLRGAWEAWTQDDPSPLGKWKVQFSRRGWGRIVQTPKSRERGFQKEGSCGITYETCSPKGWQWLENGPQWP